MERQEREGFSRERPGSSRKWQCRDPARNLVKLCKVQRDLPYEIGNGNYCCSQNQNPFGRFKAVFVRPPLFDSHKLINIYV